MPETPGGHAATIHQSPPPPQMEASKEPSHGLPDRSPQPKGLPTDGNAIAKKDLTGRKHELDKRSLDYVLRSGLAGGLAGCAVCFMSAGELAPYNC
jgi:hypothetical protein